jgi:HEAT repeat protein
MDQNHTPAQRIAAECARRGKDAFIAGCVALLDGRPGDVDDDLILALGGEHGRNVLDGWNGGKTGYWPRVWAARGLLHTWDDTATDAITHATNDEAWRVREMAAKVIARHRVGDALDAVAALRGDAVPRVRAAAERSLIRLTAGSG